MGTIGLDSGIVLTRLRAQLSDMDSSGSGRYTDTVLLSYIDSANKRIVRDVLFPDSRIEQPTQANVQLYQFPLMLKTDRIYVGGQLAIPSDIPTLEGQQTGYYDRSGDGLTAPAQYADVPDNTTGLAAPQWMITEPLSYPTTQGQWVTPAPDAGSWYADSPPRYYWRGGWLGLVPPPANPTPGTTIAVEGVRIPDQITKTDQPMSTPENFLDAIVWGACELAKFADDGARADGQRQVAASNYVRERRQLMEWRGLYEGEQRNGPKPQVLRPNYAWYRTRRKRGGIYR